MYNIPNDLMDAFARLPDVLEGLLRGYPEETLRAARGGDENWSVIEVLCHLRDAEEYALARNRAMRDQADPALPAYDQEQLAIERQYAKANLQDTLRAFVNLRQLHLAELTALPLGDWKRTGQHKEQGRITILAHTLHMVSHDLVHAAQIARQLNQIPRA
jgi:hypothetical protein